MKRKILGTTIASLLICSCAVRAPIVFEDGNAIPAPPNGQVANMNAALVEQQAHEQERATLMQKILELGGELSELKNRMLQKPAATTPAGRDASIAASSSAASNTLRGATTAVQGLAQPGVASTASTARSRSRQAVPLLTMASRAPRETIVIQETGMIFRVMHGFAKTDFRPSKSLQVQLLQAARAGKRIDIRGRTDALIANEIDREIAMQRALNARVFLANNGIHPRKMHVDYKAAGDRIADNSTAEGRARNRRVEIETAGITPDTLEDIAAVIRQDLQ